MKAATGELSLTLITVVAIGAILAFFWALWPKLKAKIDVTESWQDSETSSYKYAANEELAYIDEVYNSVM